MGSNDGKVRKAVFEALKKSLTMIDEDYMTYLIRSMKNMIQAVINAEEQYMFGTGSIKL